MSLLAVADSVPTHGPADLILALGIGLRPDGTAGPPTTAVATRVAELCRRRVARVILLSGGYRQGGVSEAEAMRAILLQSGVTIPVLVDSAPEHVQGTPRQPVTAAEIFRTQFKERPKEIVLVAHPRHLPRALWLFRRAFPQIQFFAANAEEVYDPRSSQRRLRGKVRFLGWTLLAWAHHRLFLRVSPVPH